MPAAAPSCLTRLPYYRICRAERLARRVVTISRGCAAVGEGLGYALMDFPGFEVRMLAALPFEEAVAFVRERGRRLEAQGVTHIRISTLQDLDRGRRTELPDVVGPVLAAAARHGVAVPTLAALAEVLLGRLPCLIPDRSPAPSAPGASSCTCPSTPPPSVSPNRT